MSVDVSKHLGLAKYFAYRRLRQGKLAWYLELRDLEQEAALGLCDAAQRFEPEKGQYGTYASTYVKGYLIKQWWCNRRIVSAAGGRNRRERTNDKFRGLMEGADVDIDEVDEAELIDDTALDSVALVEGGSADKLLDTLPPRQRDIFQRYVLNEETETLQEIGDSYGLSRERIRQLYELTRRQLRERAERAGYEH